MRYGHFLLLLIVHGGLLAAEPPKALVAPGLPKLTVVACPSAPTIDGNMTEPVWRKAPLEVVKGWTLAAAMTDTLLHLGVSIQDAVVASLQGLGKDKGDPDILAGDGVILMLEMSEGMSPFLAVTPEGLTGEWVSQEAKTIKPDAPWISGARAKVAWDKKRTMLQIEAAIPRWSLGHAGPKIIGVSVRRAGKEWQKFRVTLEYPAEAMSYKTFLAKIGTARKEREVLQLLKAARQAGLLIFFNRPDQNVLSLLEAEDADLEDLVEHILQYEPEERAEALPMVGWLGVSMGQAQIPEGVDPDDEGQGAGVFAHSVFGESTAERIGLEAGDIIVRVNGERVSDFQTCRQVIQSVGPGGVTTLDYVRAGEEKVRRVGAALGGRLQLAPEQ